MSAASGFRLRLRAQPAFRVDMSPVLPAALAGSSAADVARIALRHGNDHLALGELFDVGALETGAPEVRLEGDLARFDRIGQGMDGGRLSVAGSVGDYLGAAMRGGGIAVDGCAGHLAACEMAGGRLEVRGDVGDFAAGALPGSMDGMRGGTLVVRGNAGARLGDRMRRGTVLLLGDAGDFCASRMVAGTIALAGRTGAHCGYGMRRGTLVFCGPAPEVPATFAGTAHDVRVFWALLSRSLAAQDAAFAGLAARRPQRVVGDLAADGKGEWLIAG
ncbi:formylmethanofuran dehydrogenase subunit C [Thauera sinica]|uniref:Formylmethanofuran dehydrogenase subunit C n=1 Tax=Thauera sinica TaxID=2665146 RepID=A0ABW1ALB8_9RHOO|nr:formylmethanofuran dehydrogenase subunit C [Thauera sp. K11]ATE60774.1 formylmethanofuran dehydrogenase subunit C [Thauera sp. K11]